MHQKASFGARTSVSGGETMEYRKIVVEKAKSAQEFMSYLLKCSVLFCTIVHLAKEGDYVLKFQHEFRAILEDMPATLNCVSIRGLPRRKF